VVFCSDGIAEAENVSGEQFGYERTSEMIRKACEDDLSAKATIDRILEVVDRFKGDASQDDDLTCVVLRVEG
jgi:serine phosphatase RsbU (regulator of sigma subunit)